MPRRPRRATGPRPHSAGRCIVSAMATAPSTAAQVPLGRSDVRVSPIGVGAMTWGDAWGGYYGRGYGADDYRAAFLACLEGGITLFDTAEMYAFGRSERVL